MHGQVIFNPSAQSIHKVARNLKKDTCTLFNHLCSIVHDAAFVDEIKLLYPSLPLMANIRCGLWYTKGKHDDTCYFKSTDGHNNNWSFSCIRLNLNVARLAAQHGGCLIVDATRRGKAYSDAQSKTIPIWCCVINRVIHLMRSRIMDHPPGSSSWDTSLRLPLWVPAHEAVQINERMEGWVSLLLDLLGLDKSRSNEEEDVGRREVEGGGDVWGDLHRIITKPLRPLWIGQGSNIWTDSVAQPEDLPFTPLILISASNPQGGRSSMHRIQSMSSTEPESPSFSFSYVPGAGDDEESWARGLTPDDLWFEGKWDEILSLGPSVTAAQIRAHHLPAAIGEGSHNLRPMGCSQIGSGARKEWPDLNVYQIGSSEIYLGRLDQVPSHKTGQGLHTIWDRFSLILDVGLTPKPWLAHGRDKHYLQLPIPAHKKDNQALSRSLPLSLSFLSSQHSPMPVLIIDDASSGAESDASVSVCLFLLLSQPQHQHQQGPVTKVMVRQMVALVSSHYPLSRPTRSSLKAVYNALLPTCDYRTLDID